MELTLQPILFRADGPPSLDTPGAEVIQYAVIGLPAGRQALIRKRDQRWQTLVVDDGVPGRWTGDHATPQAALAALEARHVLVE